MSVDATTRQLYRQVLDRLELKGESTVNDIYMGTDYGLYTVHSALAQLERQRKVVRTHHNGNFKLQRFKLA